MYRVRTIFTGPAGSPWLATHWFSEGGGTAQQAATAARTFWDGIKAHMSTSVTAQVDPVVALIASPTGALTGFEAVTSAPVVGTGATDLAPRSTQGLVQLRTGIIANGREIRGHLFLPGVCEGDNANGGVPSAAYIADVNTAALALKNDANSAWNVYSPANHVDQTITSALCWSQWAILRSRRD